MCSVFSFTAINQRMTAMEYSLWKIDARDRILSLKLSEYRLTDEYFIVDTYYRNLVSLSCAFIYSRVHFIVLIVIWT
jgi:hypothetical protein